MSCAMKSGLMSFIRSSCRVLEVKLAEFLFIFRAPGLGRGLWFRELALDGVKLPKKCATIKKT